MVKELLVCQWVRLNFCILPCSMKILKGQFIDFQELLMDNVALLTQLQELGARAASAAGSRSRLRDVSDPVTWVYCYLSFVAVLCPDPRTRELLAYCQIIIQLAWSHGGAGWLAYDRRFCQQVSDGTPLSWAKINPSLLSATVLGSAPALSGRNCPLCLSWDHSRADCALASLVPQSIDGRRVPFRQRPYSLPGEYCRCFNTGSCPNTSESCRFLYACSTQGIPPQTVRSPRERVRLQLHKCHWCLELIWTIYSRIYPC